MGTKIFRSFMGSPSPVEPHRLVRGQRRLAGLAHRGGLVRARLRVVEDRERELLRGRADAGHAGELLGGVLLPAGAEQVLLDEGAVYATIGHAGAADAPGALCDSSGAWGVPSTRSVTAGSGT